MDIVDILTQGGPIAVAAILYWLLWSERKERIEAQSKLLAVSNAMIEHAAKTEAAINKFTDLLERVLDKIDD